MSPSTQKPARKAKVLALDEEEVPASNVRAVAREAKALTKEMEAIQHPNVESPVHKRRTRISSRNPLNEFLLFPKLPIELRLAIWSMVDTTPAVVAQRKSGVEGLAFHYSRAGGIPAVLHACRDSRREFLEVETKDEMTKAEIENRRRKHTIYKLSFRTRNKLSQGVYFSVDIDTFWPTPRTSRAAADRVRTEWKIAPTLKHLAIDSMLYRELARNDLTNFLALFPCLETLLILVGEDVLLLSNDAPIQYHNEIDGNWRPGNLNLPLCVRTIVDSTRNSMKHLKAKFPNTKFRDINFRFEEQYIQAEGLIALENDQDPPTPEAWTASRLRIRK